MYLPKRKVKSTGSRIKRFPIKEFPTFTFQDLRKFLGEDLIPRLRMVNLYSFDDVFNILWSPKPRLNPGEKRKWNPKYLRMCHKALELLGGHEDQLDVMLELKIKALVEYYCPVLPSVSLSRWPAPSPSRKQPAWLAFVKGEGSFNGTPYYPSLNFPCRNTSWWDIPCNIHWDRLGRVKVEIVGMACEERDTLLHCRESRESFSRYGGEGRELVFYPGESKKERREWFRKAWQLKELWKKRGPGLFPIDNSRVRHDMNLF